MITHLNTSSNKKLIFIIDALRPDSKDYLIHNLRVRPVFSVEVHPPFGYKPDAAFLAGLNPEESNSGAYYIYNPKNPIFPKNKWLLSLLPHKPKYLRRISKHILFILLRFIGTNTNVDKLPGSVPFKYFGLFSILKLENLYPPRCERGNNTIFQEMSRRKIRYIHFGVPNGTGKLNHLSSEVDHNDLINHDVISFFISDLDHVGHKHGGSSAEYRSTLEEITLYINKISQLLEEKHLDHQMLIFGDHGMADVRQTINIQKILKSLRAKPFKDYCYFLDSTLARFWFFEPWARDEVFSALLDDEYGHWIRTLEKDQYKINYSHNGFGEEIWWASGGTIILPNFWQGKKLIKGMHGYRNDVKDSNTILLGSIDVQLPGTAIPMNFVHKVLIQFLGLS